MKGYSFTGILVSESTGAKWLLSPYVLTDDRGCILSITKTPVEGITYEIVKGYALPGIVNAHSHAFQYAMVGLTEQHDFQGRDIAEDFWSWRSAMYQLALNLSPDQMEAIAAKLYAEMIRHGYTHVVEFHYVHHDQNAQPYTNKAEMGSRLISAAKSVGINITLIPIFYQKGGFGQAASRGQRRFLSPDIDSYLSLIEASQKACSIYPGANAAYGIHSMRAVEPSIIRLFTNQISDDLPIHIHVSEQLAEVKSAVEYLGMRPVEWLCSNIDLNEKYNLVHATHLTKEETIMLAKSKANVVLCPSTEGNLGDGLFPLLEYQKAGGKWSIGTDSHIGLNPFEELRLLDYGQRLNSHKRNIFYSKDQGNSGQYALGKIITNGRKATGNYNTNYFTIGEPMDALIIDDSSPLLQICASQHLASTIVYASDSSMHLGTIVNGKWIVEAGQHKNENTINQKFIVALKELKNRM